MVPWQNLTRSERNARILLICAIAGAVPMILSIGSKGASEFWGLVSAGFLLTIFQLLISLTLFVVLSGLAWTVRKIRGGH